MDEFGRRVARGMELLDRRCPGWEQRIVLSDLNLADGRCCILGQLFGSYQAGLDQLGIQRMRVPFGFQAASTYSNLVEVMVEYRNLTRAWIVALLARTIARVENPEPEPEPEVEAPGPEESPPVEEPQPVEVRLRELVYV